MAFPSCGYFARIGGEDDKVEIERSVWRRPMGKLEVRIHGAARFYLTGADGKTYAPPTAYQRVAGRASQRDFFHAEDKFTVDLPPGEAMLEAAKGMEYLAISKKVDDPAGRGHDCQCESRANDEHESARDGGALPITST